MKRKFILTIFILIGIYIMAYHKVLEILNKNQYEELINQWEGSLSAIDKAYIQDDKDIIDIKILNSQEENPIDEQEKIIGTENETTYEEKKKEKERQCKNILKIKWLECLKLKKNI